METTKALFYCREHMAQAKVSLGDLIISTGELVGTRTECDFAGCGRVDAVCMIEVAAEEVGEPE